MLWSLSLILRPLPSSKINVLGTKYQSKLLEIIDERWLKMVNMNAQRSLELRQFPRMRPGSQSLTKLAPPWQRRQFQIQETNTLLFMKKYNSLLLVYTQYYCEKSTKSPKGR